VVLGHRGRGDLELLQRLGDREAGATEPAAQVGLVTGGDLGRDESAEHLLGRPALHFGRLQRFGRQAPDGGQFEAPQRLVEISGQRRRRRDYRRRGGGAWWHHAAARRASAR
jgi:hypothetical protein